MRLRKLVEQTLTRPTTLVVLDGLDECTGCSARILYEAKGGRHRLLLTSRPYGVSTERSTADLEVIHKGMSESHIQAYLKEQEPDTE